MEDLVVTLVQTSLFWQQPVANRAMLEEKLLSGTLQTDLIVLPEMFTTGFSMDARSLAEITLGDTWRWLKQMASELNCCITGSFIAKEGDRFYNRLIWMYPSGKFLTYDKRHLFRMAKEQETYTAGTERITAEIKGWRIRPFICYDLRFPVWSRNLHNEYDVMIYVANWPEARRHPWRTLLKARAIENISYVIGVNRVGKDGHEHSYSGDTCAVDFKGEYLYHQEYKEEISTITLSKQSLKEFRQKFPAFLDSDDFSIHV